MFLLAVSFMVSQSNGWRCWSDISVLPYSVSRCRFYLAETMAFKETAGLYEILKTEWNKKNPNLNKCGEYLSKLKVMSHFTVVFYKF